uniref:C1q domain-containing protein n=1 Tax=Gasterosteus aculeatus aculeatus TaxID=481459 RepID=A0AAQ4NVG2_GASAC
MNSAVLVLLLFCLSPAVSRGQLVDSVPQQHVLETRLEDVITEEDMKTEDDVATDDIMKMEEDDVTTRLDDLRTEAGVPPELAVLWDELRGLKELVLSVKTVEVERRQALRSMESRLRDREVEAWLQKRSLDGLEETAVRQNEELRSTGEIMEANRKLLTELNSDLKRKMEEQSRALALELSFLQTRLRASETTVEQLRRKSTVLAVRLCNTERLMEELTRPTSVQNSNSSSQAASSDLEELNTNTRELEVRLRVSEEDLENLKREHTVQSVQLSLVESRLTENLNNTTALEVRLRSSETQREQLQNHTAGELKVAFSAGLTDLGSVGPFDEERTLIFSKTITNIGRAYNQTAGVFTAPIRGLYFFSFTATDYLKGYMGLHLYRNNQPIVFSLDLNDHGGYASTSCGVALQLEAGDGVRLSLPASYRLYDDSRNFSLFSGFLLFPL